MKPVRPKTPARKPPVKPKPVIKDPVEVYCRLRPVGNINEIVCVKPVNERTVQLTPPDSAIAFRNGTAKEIHYSFKHVFDANVSQKELFDQVALPLVQDLLQGANGLLFTYGITSSGKTYTMTGTPQDGGILPRSLDVIFNSIQDYQSMKFIFKPDKLNGFDIQSTAEAMLDQQKELGISNKTPRPRRKEIPSDWSGRVCDSTRLQNLDSDVSFSVFVSYVEIYNNYMYDLLEELPIDPIRPKPPQSKMLREDSAHNMYVFGVTEVEVKTSDEAFDMFCKGQQRRRVAHTALNTESSRSHSVFTIRIAQAPLDPQGAEVLQDKGQIVISQLSLVDLAGSERTVRTRNTGDRLREAGNINASLMALRTCIEVLREVQAQGGSKMVPYRESKLTHLFKTFFEGEGKIRMIVCVNPRGDDYDETVHVMRFAEMTQEVLISRPTPISTPVTIGLRSGRGNMYRDAVRKAKEAGVTWNEILAPAVYSLGPDFPDFSLNQSTDDATLINLIEFLEDRKSRRYSLRNDLSSRQNEFRKQLLNTDKENISLKQQTTIFQMDLEAREQQVKSLERKLSSAEQANEVLQKRLSTYERNARCLEYQLTEKEQQLTEGEKEKEKIKAKMHDRLAFEKERMHRIMEKRLAEKQAELETKMCLTEERFRQLREILNSGDWEFGGDAFGTVFNVRGGNVPYTATPESVPPEPRLTRASTTLGNIKQHNVPSGPTGTNITSSRSDTRLQDSQKPPTKSVAVANPRHHRSHSSGGEVWLEHKPVGSLDLGTVLQPKMKKKKSVSKLEVKDVTKDVSKYVLTHQEQDSKGEVETQLYKGDVIPSAGGGAQVIFSDVEKLRQTSPTSYNLRKRSAEDLPRSEVEDRCTVAVECHGKPSKVLRKAK